MPVGNPRAKVELTADSKKLNAELAAARSKMRSFGADVARGLKGTAGKGLSFLSRAFDPLGKGFDIAGDAVTDVLDYERAVTRLAIAQGKGNSELGNFRAALNDASIETGLARNEILRGVTAYQALTGDTEGATAATRTFARVAQATGSNVEAVAGAAASLRDNLKIDPGQFERLFSVLNVQGKAGSVELKDFASEIAALSASFKQFKGGTGLAGATELGAAFQTVRKDVGSSSEAATRLLRLMDALARNANKLRAEGVRVFDIKHGKEVRRTFSAIIEDFRNSNIKESELGKLLGSSEASQALKALTGHWGDFKQLVDTTDFGSIDRDLKQFSESAAGQLEASMNRLKLSIAQAFTPERIQAFAAGIERVIPMVERAATAVGKLFDMVDTFWNANEKVQENVFDWADKRKAELVSQGMSPDDAGKQARRESLIKSPVTSNPAVQKLAADAGAQANIRALNKIAGILNAQKGETVLKIDGNTAARAVSNAPRSRQKP